jgi:hypothetical protein
VTELVSQLVSELENISSSVLVSRCCDKLVAEAVDSSEVRRKENDSRWKPLPSNGIEYVTVDTSVFVIVNCEV